MALVVPLDPNRPEQPRAVPSEGNLIMAAGIMYDHNRLVDPDFKAGQASWLSDWWHGKPNPDGTTREVEPPDQIPSAPMISGKETGFGGKEHYPTPEEAEFAERAGLAYGKSWEDHFMNQNIRIYGESGKSGWQPKPVFMPGYTSNEIERRAYHGDPKTLPTSMMTDQARSAVAHWTSRAALAAGRDPIATLGFDPGKASYDLMSKKAIELGGFTLNYSPDAPQKAMTPSEWKKYELADRPMFISGAQNEMMTAPAILVHESIHRGLEYLFKHNPEAIKEYNKMFDRWMDTRTGAMKESGADPNEMLVRHIMRTTMGNPEDIHVNGRLLPNAQIEAAENFFDDPKNLQSVSKIQAMAAKEIAKKHPMGPR